MQPAHLLLHIRGGMIEADARGWSIISLTCERTEASASGFEIKQNQKHDVSDTYTVY